MPAVIHVLNMELLKEWWATSGEFFALLRHPFSKVPLRRLFLCTQSNWDDTLAEWVAIQLIWSIVINIIANILLIALGGVSYVGWAIFNCIVGVITSYLYSHLAWFGVLKKGGCLCFLCVCCTGAQILNLIFGVWLILWAAILIADSAIYISYFDLGFLYTILYASNAIPLCYMGMCCVKIWHNHGDEGLPGQVKVESSVTQIGASL
ncbi:unnamed protein product [Polarella glacialis]|uniref:Uncharacterized protein n=1 Tax=Polarella glacialis TaxID=89957 RepID=A0A813HTW0_POLGL|nr:unnamed protein product [Polarella glacialis]CAE8680982.1 unnamed protein product [Polarella glacialis]|eukprot:CAMPEP_0115064620 /NCGR_PEP_ID=MMETSP0227-20121206/9793_1 /TAXON_ID=89957 /ORGANISM="Polarella glacialis, Strain CCMP 1383" /LENGTH=206 /DNA_ID=CAMNT_0002450311 /DNA_START=34 /DNA_END=654 /DNA_ORIENTATION=-